MASTNISIGPAIQFWKSEKVNTFLFSVTFPISSYLTLASGGYIMTISPMAIGHDIVPVLIPPRDVARFGNRYPPPIPIAMAINIHRVKNLSKNDNFSLLILFILYTPYSVSY